jgi:pimeloyl-ACP methyl ester carboxylesterase
MSSATAPTTLVVRVQGEGPDVAVLPSFVGAYWTPGLEALSSSYRVHLLQLPGFGDFEVPAQARRVLDLASLAKVAIADAGLIGAPLIGHSFGGWLAMELALIAPPSKLVLVDPLGLRIRGESREDLFDRPREDVLDVVYADRSVAPTDWSRNADRRNLAALARYAWNPYLCDLSLPVRLAGISSPTLVVWGDQDRVVPPTHGKLLADLVPGARLERLVGAGHDPLSDDPNGFATIVGGFLGAKES